MIKVFLVEDEIVIRNGIKSSIDWAGEGYEFVGEAGDGELAYPMILKEKPDILITDIRMPFMGGLELSRLVKQELPDTKILILSGYDEFDYAKEAIRLQVTDYLLKPVSSAKLLETLGEVKMAILQEREERELYKKYKEDMQENREFEKEQFLTKILTQSLSVTETLEQGKHLDMELGAALYNTFLVKFTARENRDEIYIDAEKPLSEIDKTYCFRRGIDEWLLLLLADDEGQMQQRIETCKQTIQHIVETCPCKIEYFGAIGMPVLRFRELKDSLKDAERKFSCRFLREWNQIVEGSVDIQSEHGPEQQNLKEQRADADRLVEKQDSEELNISSVQVDKLDRKATERFLSIGLKSEVSDFVDDYFASLGEKSLQSLLFRQYVTMDFYLSAVAAMESMGYSSEELVKSCGDFKDMEDVLLTLERTKEYVKNVISVTVELRESLSKRRYSALLEDAIAFIEENFDNEDISLHTVAASVGMSPNHFSTIFSKEMDETFVEFLTHVRMHRAKELLRTTAMKTAEVGYAVGYKDSHYFSYLFKKTQKCTPREFRAQV